MGITLTILLWLFISYLVMSAVEYALHRYPMHSRRFVVKSKIGFGSFERHAVLHHGRYFRIFDEEHDVAAKHVSFVLSPIENMLGLTPLAFLFWLIDPVGSYIFIGFVGAHALLWSIIHREMHIPAGRWFAKTRIFRYLRAYHKTHHDHPGTNFNIICLGADKLFGTYRTPEA